MEAHRKFKKNIINIRPKLFRDYYYLSITETETTNSEATVTEFTTETETTNSEATVTEVCAKSVDDALLTVKRLKNIKKMRLINIYIIDIDDLASLIDFNTISLDSYYVLKTFTKVTNIKTLYVNKLFTKTNSLPTDSIKKCGEGVSYCRDGCCCSKYGYSGKSDDYYKLSKDYQSELGLHK
ncbi:hypothetical protein U3516DRAFT_761549 [Neocallimastix sp. 'constans']